MKTATPKTKVWDKENMLWIREEPFPAFAYCHSSYGKTCIFNTTELVQGGEP